MDPGHCTGPLPSSWTDAHDTELGFQQQKDHRRRVEAAAGNLLISKDGVVSAFRGEASELRKRQVKDELARRSRANRITAALTGQSRTAVLEAIRHKKVC